MIPDTSFLQTRCGLIVSISSVFVSELSFDHTEILKVITLELSDTLLVTEFFNIVKFLFVRSILINLKQDVFKGTLWAQTLIAKKS